MKGHSMTTETNKAAVKRYIEEVINQGNLAVIDTLFSPEMRRASKGLCNSRSKSFPDRYEEISRYGSGGRYGYGALGFSWDASRSVLRYSADRKTNRDQRVWNLLFREWADRRGFHVYGLDGGC